MHQRASEQEKKGKEAEQVRPMFVPFSLRSSRGPLMISVGKTPR
jgi:hypothetical protein